MIMHRIRVSNPFDIFRTEPYPGPGTGNLAYLSELLPFNSAIGAATANQGQLRATAPQKSMLNVQPAAPFVGGGTLAGELWQQPLQSGQQYAL